MAPQHPTLYASGPDGLHLRYARCGQCARLSFPANVPGCGRCGAVLDQAGQVSLRALGMLLESVTVHAPLAGPGVPSAVVGLVEIADGLAVEAELVGPNAHTWPPGTALTARPAPHANGDTFRCVFTAQQGAPE